MSVPVSSSDRYEIRVVHTGESATPGEGYFGSTERDGTWVRVDEVTFQRRFQPL